MPVIRIISDILVIYIASLVAYVLRFNEAILSQEYLLGTLLVSLIYVVFSIPSQRYEPNQLNDLSKTIKNTFSTWTATFIISLIGAFFTKSLPEYSRLWISYFFLNGLVLHIILNAGNRYFIQILGKCGIARKKILLLGEGDVLNALSSYESEEMYGYTVKEQVRLDNEKESWGALIGNVPKLIEAQNVEEIWICLPLKFGDYIEKIVYQLRHSTAEIRYIPKLSDLRLLNNKTSTIAGHYAIDLSCSPLSGFNRYLKRFEDVFVTLLLTPILIPLCILIAVFVCLTSSGPILFKQQRHGIGANPIKVYKFRSMTKEASNSTIVDQAKQYDQRVTKFGKLLRSTSLDELPQFFNVLQGRMSIVGPRPHALQHNEYYKDLVESYMWRHKVKPGITGWAQVNGLRGETDTIEKMEARVKADLWYIENWSLWLDIKIIILTVFKGFINKNAY